MFSVGDIVMLKSGGPKMTICATPNQHTSYFKCEWFDESVDLKYAMFPQDAIKLIPESSTFTAA